MICQNFSQTKVSDICIVLATFQFKIIPLTSLITIQIWKFCSEIIYTELSFYFDLKKKLVIIQNFMGRMVKIRSGIICSFQIKSLICEFSLSSSNVPILSGYLHQKYPQNCSVEFRPTLNNEQLLHLIKFCIKIYYRTRKIQCFIFYSSPLTLTAVGIVTLLTFVIFCRHNACYW